MMRGNNFKDNYCVIEIKENEIICSISLISRIFQNEQNKHSANKYAFNVKSPKYNLNQTKKILME